MSYTAKTTTNTTTITITDPLCPIRTDSYYYNNYNNYYCYNYTVSQKSIHDIFDCNLKTN